MQIATINNHPYKLNSYYTESNGRLHLFINNNDKYDLNEVESDILADNAIVITAEGSEEELGRFMHYTILRHLEVRFEDNPQIYVMVDVSSFESLVESLRQEVIRYKANVEDLINQNNILSLQMTELYDRVHALEIPEVEELEEEIPE